MVVAFDAVGPSSAASSTTTAATLTWTHTSVGSSGLVGVVGVALGALNTTQNGYTLSVTWGGVAMTSIGKVQSNGGTVGYVQLFGLVGPPTGARSIVVTASGTPASLVGGSTSFTGGASFGTAVTSSSSNTDAFVTVLNTTVGNMLVDAVCCGSAITSSMKTLRWNANATGNSGAGNGAQSTTASTGGNVAMEYTVPSDYWGIIAVEIFAVAAAFIQRAPRTARTAVHRAATR